MNDYEGRPLPEWLEKLLLIQQRESEWAARLQYLERVIASLKKLGDSVLGFNCFDRTEFPDGFLNVWSAENRERVMSFPVKASAVLPWAEAYLEEQKALAAKRPSVLGQLKELAESIE